MGITGIWDYFGEGEVKNLADLATEYLVNEGRSLRIAVDEANWRFLNLTPEQVKAIQMKEPASRPVEKANFHRIVGLQQINIQLLFVFDGPHRPWKRGRRGGNKIDYDELKLTKEVLRMLGVPHHEAPGEAEAECARLQQEGVVDAVWTDDSDAMMFGATRLVRSHYEGKKKSTTHIRLFEAKSIKEKSGLDRDGMVLFAMLSGGDYNTKGLAGCGPSISLEAAKAGLGRSLCAATSPLELQYWRHELVEFFASKRKAIDVPLEFPCAKTLKKYTHPSVSTIEQLHNLRGLRNGWDGRALDEVKLRFFLRTRFNIQTKGYIKHVLPTLLVNTLSLTEPGLERANNIYNVELVANKRKKAESAMPSRLKKVTFLPQSVTTLDLGTQPIGPEDAEDWSQLGTKAGGRFDPLAKAECEILECILRRGVPQALEEERKRAEADATSSQTKKSRQVKQSGTRHEDVTDAPKSTKKRKAISQEVVLHSNTTTTPTASARPQKVKKQSTIPKGSHPNFRQDKTGQSSQSSTAPTVEKATPTKKPKREFLVPPSLALAPHSQQSHSTSINHIASPQQKAMVVDLSLENHNIENVFTSQLSPRRPSLLAYPGSYLASSPLPDPSSPEKYTTPPFQRDHFSSPQPIPTAAAPLQELPTGRKPMPVNKPSWATHGFALLDNVVGDSAVVNPPAPAGETLPSPVTAATIGRSTLGGAVESMARRPVTDIIDLTLD